MKRTLVAAAALTVGTAFPLAGVAVAQEGDRDCPDFATQQEAQEAFEAVSGDPERLDGDDDGIACENNPDGTETPSQQEQGTSGTAESGETGSRMPSTGQDNGQMPSGGVEAGYGGTEGNNFEILLPLGLAGSAALAAGGVVVMRRRPGNSARSGLPYERSRF